MDNTFDTDSHLNQLKGKSIVHLVHKVGILCETTSWFGVRLVVVYILVVHTLVKFQCIMIIIILL